MDDLDKEFEAGRISSLDEEFEAGIVTSTKPKQTILEKITPSAETVEESKDALSDYIIDPANDFSRAVAGGLTANAMDEIGGGIGATLETIASKLPFTDAYKNAQIDEELRKQGFQLDKESFIDKYRGYQKAGEAEMKMSADRSPWLSVGGQIAGGITSGTILGNILGIGKQAANVKTIAEIAKKSGKGKAALELGKRGLINYGKASPMIAAEGALSSEGTLIGDNATPDKVVDDTIGSLLFGIPAIAGLDVASEVVGPMAREGAEKVGKVAKEYLDESPLFRQASIAYTKYGKEAKVNPRSEKAVLEGNANVEGGTPFSLIDTKRASTITDQILKVDGDLGKAVGEAIDSSNHIRIDASDLLDGSIQDALKVMQDLPSTIDDRNFGKITDKIFKRNYSDASPKEIKAAIEDITSTIDQIGGYKNPTPELEEVPRILRNFRRQLDQRLKQKVPRYRDAAERFSQHRVAYMEQPIAGRLDPELDDLLYGKLKKGEKKLTEAVERLVKSTTAGAQSAEGTEANFSKLAEAAKKFQASEEARVAAGKIQKPITEDPTAFLQRIKDFSDDAAVRRSARKTQESQGGSKLALKDAVGVAETGRGAVLSGAYYAGRIAGSGPVTGSKNIGKLIYKAPSQTLTNLAARLEASPSLKLVGKSLREGIESGDAGKKNAALFTIMQNPNARLFIDEDELEDQNEFIEE